MDRLGGAVLLVPIALAGAIVGIIAWAIVGDPRT
jgi:hypothetical protein